MGISDPMNPRTRYRRQMEIVISKVIESMSESMEDKAVCG